MLEGHIPSGGVFGSNWAIREQLGHEAWKDSALTSEHRNYGHSINGNTGGKDRDGSSRSNPEAPQAAGASGLKTQTDEVLVDWLREGDRTAFDELYRRYFRRVYGFLDKRLRNRADTEETTQEVFINIFSAIDSYRGEAPFAAWVFGLTRRTLAGRFRRKQHPTVPLFEEDDERAYANLAADTWTEATPLENYEMAECAAHLRQTLECDVTPEQRQLFELHHLQSMPIAEIARTVSRSEDSVKSNLYRTRKLLLAR
jgi:RNA polymerase sigma-70 factor (ECF subfamily)